MVDPHERRRSRRRGPAGLLINEARLRSFLTQAELAERMGVDQSSVSRWENGALEPTFRDLLRAVRAAGFRIELELRSAPENGAMPAGSIWIQHIRSDDAAAVEPRRRRALKLSPTRRYLRRPGERKGPHIDPDRSWPIIPPRRGRQTP